MASANTPATKGRTVEETARQVDIRRINQELYKRNVELAFRNKTLSLLRKLYYITLSTFELRTLGQLIVDTIRAELRVEMIGISVLEAGRLKPLAFSFSDDLASLIEAPGTTLGVFSYEVDLTRSGKPYEQALKTKQLQITNVLADLSQDEQALAAVIQRKADIKNTLVFPLITKEKSLGTLIIALNRTYRDLSDFERETFDSFVSVISVALDKALLYDQLRLANVKLSRMNVQLEKLLKAQSEFLDIASHQLRTPVSVIRGIISMIQDGDMKRLPKQKQDAFIDSAAQKGAKLDQIINDILAASELDSQKFTVDSKTPKIQLEQVVDRAVKGFALEAEQRAIDLKWECPKTPFPPVIGNDSMLEQAISNFVSNSLKYTPSTEMVKEARAKRKAKGLVKVEIKQKNGDIVVSVADNGIGIPADEVKKLFHKFSRASNATAMYTDGSGLGLFIVKEIIEGHHGKVWVESEEGKGSRFSFSIPVARD